MGRLFRRLVRSAGLMGLALTALADYALFVSWKCGGAKRRAGAWWLQSYARWTLRLGHVRLKSPEAWPQTPLYVFNHLTYLDVLVLSAIAPLCFIAKSEVSGWALFGWHARCAGTLFVRRDRRRDVERVARLMEERARDGVGIVLFAEGTSSDGRQILPFRTSLLEPAAANQWKVTPGLIRYSTPDGDASTEVCWWGDARFAPHLWHALGLREIHAEVSVGEPATASDRKELGRILHDQVDALLKSGQPA